MLFVKKPDIEEWANDCKELGRQLKRYGFANTQLPDDMVANEYKKTVRVIQDFANKYGMGYDSAEQIAAIISDSVAI